MALVIKTTGFEQYLDPANGSYLKCLILGEHGSGKTPWASYWPGVIFAAAENGLMSVASRGVPFGLITSEAEMDQMIALIKRDAMQPPERRKYHTLVIDTIDAYQRILVAARVKAERKEALSGWADYGWLATKTNGLIEQLQNLPVHVVVLMHVKDKEDEQDGATIQVKKSRLKGEAADTIYQDFDLIGLMENTYVADDGERVLKRQIRWQSEPRYPMLRDRSGRLPQFTDVNFNEDDFNVIFNTVVGAVDDMPATADYDVAPEIVVDPETQEVTEAPVAPDVKGGPVANPEVPKPVPAKKTVAKKAAPAKKTAAPVPQQRTEPTPEQIAEAAADSAAKAEATAPVDDPVELVKDQLGGEVESETPNENAKPEETAAPEPEAPAEAPAGPVCGSQPPGLTGDPAPGCGTTLTRQNAVKLSMAQLRTKTALCDECFDKWKKDN